MNLLILAPALAATVRGPTSNGAVLAPRQLTDGDFALPVRVLDDPAHAVHHAALNACPRRPLEECAWLASEDEV